MTINKTTIALCILATFALSGCGTDATPTALTAPPTTTPPTTTPPTTTPPTTPPEVIPPATEKTITVIDGYLTNAEICADINVNFICDPDERLGVTKEGGVFALPLEFAKYPLLATITANKTQDSDNVGEVIKGYALMAEAGLDFITPITTTAYLEKSTLQEMADYMNLDVASVSGDYVAMAQGGNIDAFKAHIIARAIAWSLSPTIDETINQTGPNRIKLAIDKTAEVIGQEEGKGTLDTLKNIRIEVDEFGNVTRHTLFNNLDNYLTGTSTWLNASLNLGTYPIEEITSNTFSKGKLTRTPHPAGTPEAIYEYTITNNLLSYDNPSLAETDTFIYLSAELALSVGGNNQDLQYWLATSTPISYPMTEQLFSGKTWFELFDKSNTVVPDPFMREYSFRADKTGTVTTLADAVTKKMTWTVTKDELNILYEGESFPELFTLMAPSETSNGVIIVDNKNPRLMIDSKEQLDSILYQWNKSKTANNAMNK